MVYMPATGSSRLVQVRALRGAYPFYGALETVPPAAAATFQSGRYALVDDGLMIQYALSVGDSVRIGDVYFTIAGRLMKIPGETVAMSTIGPRVYIPMAYLEETGLIQVGSRINYRVYMGFEPKRDVEAMAAGMRPLRERYFVNVETVETRKRQLGRSLGNLYRFLNLGGFIALILGSVGVASAVNTYVRHKLNTVAVLRCLGADARQTFIIYLVQSVCMGLIGSAAGVILGVAILYLLPAVIADFLPFTMQVALSWTPIVQGMGIGLLMALLFALLPLLSIRAISPLLTLRSSYEPPPSSVRDPWRLLVYLLLIGGIAAFGVSQTREWTQGVGFAGGLIAAFLALTLVARGVMRCVRWAFPDSWSYIWRQGLANLFRPHNQTIMLVVALGLGTFLLTTLYIVQQSLVGHLSTAGSGNQSNMVIFDIQNDQKEDLTALMRQYDLPVMQEVPVVTMRIAGLKGRTVEDIRSDSLRTGPDWPLRREYRSTYRDRLMETETLLAGRFAGKVDTPGDTVYVSLAQDIAEDLRVGLGDEIVFDVQGVSVRTVVGSIRAVNWQRVQPNFFVVFPEGVLEAAPQFHVMVTRIADPVLSATFQRDVITRFPNVSMIDLRLILSTVDAILEKVSLVVRFMALFSVFTGLIVLIGVITNSRYQRIQESVLLKTLGGTRRQIFLIMILEYLFLGTIGAGTGVLLAMGASWSLARLVFDITYVWVVWPTMAVVAGVVAVTILVGIAASRGIHNRPPLEILRAEA
jgi:putative ABC transport system permease protein